MAGEIVGLLVFALVLVGLLMVFALNIFLFIFWLVELIDCLKRKKFKHADKIVWILIFIFLSWLGAVLYYFVEKRDSKKSNISKKYK